MNNLVIEKSSFKDSDSSVVIINNEIYRQINFSYKDDYDKLMNSGLYDVLIEKGLLISHYEVETDDVSYYKLLKPEKVFISYPWEWSFSQIKDAALATLEIQLIALEHGMSLKDANCYNIQFKNNKPLLIDTASFEIYEEGQPWVAYRQFCENFLSILCLMAYKDIRLNSLLVTNINGIPLDLAVKLLPAKLFLNFDLLCHLKLHSMLQNKYAGEHKKKLEVKINLQSQINLVKNLINCVKNIKLKNFHTEWDDYYNFTNYEKESFEHKKEILCKYKNEIEPCNVWDFGANTGLFSRLFLDCSGEVLALDIDPLAVEKNYLTAKKNNEINIRPLVFDLVNPSPSIGWDNHERTNIISRSNKPDLVMALALIHHLRITYNIPFYKIRDYFAQIAPYLIIEFVNKEDSQVKKLLLNRKDVFDDYSIENFERVFGENYEIIDKTSIKNTERFLYLLRRRI